MPVTCEIGASQRGPEPWNEEAEESTTLEADTKQRHWEQWSARSSGV
jgi:hypothetical protein